MRASIVALALAVGGFGSAGAAEPVEQASLTISYWAALTKCHWAELRLRPNGDFEVSVVVHDKELAYRGRTDTVYWDRAMDVLESNHFEDIQSIDSYYNTVAPDAPDADERLKEIGRNDTYVMFDGGGFTIDWRDKYGSRLYLSDDKGGRSPTINMLQSLLREVQFEKRTCGHFFQNLVF